MGLSGAEKRYAAHKLEFLALKWSVVDKFADYLYGCPFTVITDKNPLTYALSTAKLDATSQRWIAALASFDFDIQYRPGVNNADADSMSRHPDPQGKQEVAIITNDVIKALNYGMQVTPYIYSIGTSDKLLDHFQDSARGDNSYNIREGQKKDAVLSVWIPLVTSQQKPTRQEIPSTPTHMTMLRSFEKLKMIDDILCREVVIDGELKIQQVVPQDFVPTILTCTMLHQDLGHQGRDRTLSIVRDRFYWVGMTKDVENWIQKSSRCILRKTPDRTATPLVNINTYQPLELVCMDFLSLETSKGGYNNILVITDHFTRYAIAVPTRNMTARTTADAFYNNFVVHYGLPQRIHSDQGPNFESRLFKELCSIIGAEKSHTTPYHPMGNGLCERFNRTLLGMLGTLSAEQKKNWRAHVSSLVHAYNCTRQESTGHTPYFLMFGRSPRLPVDLAFGINLKKENQSMKAYVEGLRSSLKCAYELAARSSSDAKTKQKEYYDRGVREAVLHTGDRVLVKIVAFDGKHKLSNKWEEEPYLVIDQPNTDIPVYIVRKESGEGRTRTLHRNILLPIGFLSPIQQDPDKPIPLPRSTVSRNKPVPSFRKKNELRPVLQRRQPSTERQVNPSSEDTDSSSSEEELLVECRRTRISDTQEHDTSNEDENEDGIEESSEVQDVQIEDAGAEDVHVEEGQEVTSGSSEEDHAVPRRSQRKRDKPAWMRSGQYSFKQQTSVEPDWQRRVRLLTNMASSGVLANREDKVADALLDLITGRTSSDH